MAQADPQTPGGDKRQNGMPRDGDLTQARQGLGGVRKEVTSLGCQLAWSHLLASYIGHCLGRSPSLAACAHLQGPGGNAVHDGGPLQAALLQLAKVHFIELLQVRGHSQVVVCRGKGGAQRGPAGPCEWPGHAGRGPYRR